MGSWATARFAQNAQVTLFSCSTDIDDAMKTKQSNTSNRLEFPCDGKVRAKQIAEFLAIGVSTWWLYVKQGRVEQPQRYGKRVSVWDARYVRDLAENGIPDAVQEVV